MGLGQAHASSWKRTFARLLMAAGLAAVVVGAAGPAAAQETAPAGAATELLKFAPEGVWAAGAVEIAKLLSAPTFDGIRTMSPELGEATQGFEAAAAFILPMERPLDDYDGPMACGLVRLGEGKRASLESWLADERMDADVAGLAAYDGDGVILAFVDDSTLAFGVDEGALTAIVGSYRSGPGAGVGAELKAVMGPHADRASYGGMVLPVPLGQAVSAPESEDMPEWARGLSAGAVGIDLAEGLALRLHLRLASAEAVQQLIGETQESIAETKEGMKAAQEANPMMAQGMAPVLAILDKLKLTGEGPDFRVSLDLTQEETKAAPGIMFFPMMMASQAMSAQPGGGLGEARKAKSTSNLHNIGLGIMMHCNAHQEQYPPNLAVLFDEGYIEDETVLIDPADVEPEVDEATGRLSSYRYVGEVPSRVPPNFILCYTRKGIHEGSRVVLYADCAVVSVTEEDLHKSGAGRGMSLWDCYHWAADNWRGELVEKDDARLRKFFEVKG